MLPEGHSSSLEDLLQKHKVLPGGDTETMRGWESCFPSAYGRSLETLAKYSKIPGYRLNLFSLTKMLLTTAKKTMPTINANPLITACW
jgi:hypothetical protein